MNIASDHHNTCNKNYYLKKFKKLIFDTKSCEKVWLFMAGILFETFRTTLQCLVFTICVMIKVNQTAEFIFTNSMEKYVSYLGWFSISFDSKSYIVEFFTCEKTRQNNLQCRK